MATKTQDRSDGRAPGAQGTTEGLESMARPEDLRAYEELAPGSAEKLIEAYRVETEHRRDLERRRSRTVQRRDLFTVLATTLTALAAFGASTWLVSRQQQLPGTIFGVLALVGAFGLFLVLLLRRTRT